MTDVAVLDPVRVAEDYATLDGSHKVYRHDPQSVTVDGIGLSSARQIETLERFAEEIAPVVRREAPTTLWT